MFLLISTNKAIDRLIKIVSKKIEIDLVSISDLSNIKNLERFSGIIIDDDMINGDPSAIFEIIKGKTSYLIYGKKNSKIDGFDEYIQKPFLPVTMFEALSKLPKTPNIDKSSNIDEEFKNKNQINTKEIEEIKASISKKYDDLELLLSSQNVATQKIIEKQEKAPPSSKSVLELSDIEEIQKALASLDGLDAVDTNNEQIAKIEVLESTAIQQESQIEPKPESKTESKSTTKNIKKPKTTKEKIKKTIAKKPTTKIESDIKDILSHTIKKGLKNLNGDELKELFSNIDVTINIQIKEQK